MASTRQTVSLNGMVSPGVAVSAPTGTPVPGVPAPGNGIIGFTVESAAAVTGAYEPSIGPVGVKVTSPDTIED